MLCANRKSIRILESSTHSQSTYLPTMRDLAKVDSQGCSAMVISRTAFLQCPCMLRRPPPLLLESRLWNCAASLAELQICAPHSPVCAVISKIRFGQHRHSPVPAANREKANARSIGSPRSIGPRRSSSSSWHESTNLNGWPGWVEARVGALEHPLATPAFSDTPIDSRFSAAIWQRELPPHTRGEEAVACCACSPGGGESGRRGCLGLPSAQGPAGRESKRRAWALLSPHGMSRRKL